MKKIMLSAILLVTTFSGIVIARDLKEKDVPPAVKTTFAKRYPQSKNNKVSWEKEKGNYEANWGGKSGEDNSAVFTPAAIFVELVQTIPISQLPVSFNWAAFFFTDKRGI